MKRTNRLLGPIGVIVFLLLCFIPGAQSQVAPNPLSYQSGVPFQLGVGFSFTSSSTQSAAFNVGGLQYFEIVWVPNGTVSGCTLTLDGAPIAGGSFSVGSLVASQTCTSAGSFTTSSATQAAQAKLTPTVTGSGTVTVFVFGFVNNPASSGGGGGAVTQSGTWNVRVQDSLGNGITSNSATQSRSLDVNLVSLFGATHSATNPLFSRYTDGTTAVTACVSAWGVAPTGTQCPGFNANLIVSATLATQVNPSGATGAATSFSSQSALTTAVVAKASSGTLWGFSVTNGAASVCYLQFINAASAPVLGTAAQFSIAIPASATLTSLPGAVSFGFMATGISIGMSTTYNGSTACGTAATAVLFYK